MNLFTLLRFIIRHPLNRDRPLKAVMRFLRWQIGSRLLPKAIVPFVGDKVLVVSRGMTGATGNIYCGLHEYEEMAFTLHLLRPGDLFVDIGANIGSYTMLAAAAGARVVAFEPGERYRDLMLNVAVNGADAQCHRMALGGSDGVLRFTVGRDTTNRAALDGEGAVEVPVRRLDDVVRDRPKLIKCDVEGYEAAVLSGGRQTFAAASAVIMELGGHGARYGFDEDAIRAEMQQMGFRPVGYDPRMRSLMPLGDRSNTIFVRDADCQALLHDGPAYTVGDRQV